MDKQNFHVKVKEIAAKNPRLFALESDNRADDEMIKDVERYYEKMVDYLKKALIYGHTSRISS